MSHLVATSSSATVAALEATNTGVPKAGVAGSAVAVEGSSDAGFGVYGHSKTGRGVVAVSESDYGLRAHSAKSAGIRGSSDAGRGVEGWGQASEGVVGLSVSGNGVWGQTDGGGVGTLGTSNSGPGVVGASKSGPGVTGESTSSYGVAGGSQTFAGVRGTSSRATGTEGWSTSGAGVAGMSVNGDGVFGMADEGGNGVTALSAQGVGLYAKGGRLAAFFEGDVQVTGDISLNNGDCAEDFDVIDASLVAPGTVMVLGLEGVLSESTQPYDRRVAGVVSGAGTYRPGITLDKQIPSVNRIPIGLLGKVFCKVDAQYGAIGVGDLLTTSATPGHAMKADDPARAFGSVIGKALRPLERGQGMVPILITLQ